MNFIKVKGYDKLSRAAANIISAQVITKPNSVLGLATGSSPIGAYKQLIEWYNKGDVDFSKVTTVNLDEYVGIEEDNPQSYHFFMKDNLFNHININMDNTHVPCGKSDDLLKECKAYDELIKSVGGIDLQLLGIGDDGHIGFNEPGDVFACGTNIVDLHPETISANSRFFGSLDKVPRKAITMGMAGIMQAKKVLLIAGSSKKAIVEKAFFGDITPKVPASILQLHPDLTVILDEGE